ncbi:MAG: hypothetical protein Q8O67_25915 [Deltaproteobacteria bacterium]|nr:hypothetical protein [Deltaproteobacteria bacterium]
MLLALVLCAPALLADESRTIDVAVTAGDQDAVVVDAVRAAVVIAARERHLRVVDLLAQGLGRQWKACPDLACRRALATRRGAEWHLVIADGDDVDLALFEEGTRMASVQLQGPRFAQLGRVNDAVDGLLDQVRPRSHVQRQDLLKTARDRRRDSDLRGAADAYGQAFALVVDDRAVEIAVARAGLLEELGDEGGRDASFALAETALLAIDSPLSPQARARFIVSLQDHLWRRARLLSDVAEADRGPDHGSLAAAAFDAWQRLATSAWVDPDVSKRAAEQAGRWSIDAAIHESAP